MRRMVITDNEDGTMRLDLTFDGVSESAIMDGSLQDVVDSILADPELEEKIASMAGEIVFLPNDTEGIESIVD